jgi:cell division protein ZapA (FtsZ GTPase activity inhibitor)
VIGTHQLTIAGQRLTVRSAAEPAYVARLAAELDGRIARVGAQGAGPLVAALLAALGLADELEKAQDEAARLRGEVVRRSDEILATLAESMG